MIARLRAVLVLLTVVIIGLIWFEPPAAIPTTNTRPAKTLPRSQVISSEEMSTDAPVVTDAQAGSTDIPRPVSTATIPATSVIRPPQIGLLSRLLQRLFEPIGNVLAAVVPTVTPIRPVEIVGRVVPTAVVPTPVMEPTAAARVARVPILMYHYVSVVPDLNDALRTGLSVSPEILDEHLKFFKEHGWHTIALQDLYDFLHSGRPLPSKPVILTFDDGYLDAYTNAFPLLKKYGLSATFFIFTGAIGFNQNYLSWNEIQEMSSAGMSIESHTYTHPDMRNRSDEFLQSQIRLPVDAIAKATGKRPRFFAYPAGQFDANAVRMLIANDTLGAVTTRPGMIHQLGNALTWDRVRVTGNMPLGALVQIIGN